MNSHIIYNTDDGIIIIGMSIYSAAWRVKPVRTNIDVITNNGRLYKSFFILTIYNYPGKIQKGSGVVVLLFWTFKNQRNNIDY